MRPISVAHQHGFHEPTDVTAHPKESSILIEARNIGIDVENVLGIKPGTHLIGPYVQSIKSEVEAHKRHLSGVNWHSVSDPGPKYRLRAVAAEYAAKHYQQLYEDAKQQNQRLASGSTDDAMKIMLVERESLLTEIERLVDENKSQQQIIQDLDANSERLKQRIDMLESTAHTDKDVITSTNSDHVPQTVAPITNQSHISQDTLSAIAALLEDSSKLIRSLAK